MQHFQRVRSLSRGVTGLEQAKLQGLVAMTPDNLGLIATDAALPPGVPAARGGQWA